MNKLSHVAIIMDGNGRWAKDRNRPRVWGHIRGSHLVSDIVERADKLEVEHLTFYALSYENLSRPNTELHVLFKLLEKFLLKEKKRIIDNNIKFKVIGDYSFVSKKLQDLIESMIFDSSQNKGLNLNFAFGHSGRKTIEQCVENFRGQNSPVSAEMIESFFKNETPDVDLMIRTGGDHRISNFLIWQLAYAEFYFTNTKWPDFTADQFAEILNEVQAREKRFGGIGEVNSFFESREKAKKKLTQGIL